MDNLIFDNSNSKFKINEFLESHIYTMDKRSALIYKELENLKDEYKSIIIKGIYFSKKLTII